VGVKGRAPSKAEKQFHAAIAALGCIACRMDGVFTELVSIHHIDGRTKPGAHMKVLPLCAGHHQDNTGAPGLIAVHPWKKRFEQRYGSQAELLAQCVLLMEQNNETNAGR
jgi:hypothetical protein